MKNENIDKKNKGLKIGIIVLSIFSSILLIFNLLLCATFKDKDYQIKALENSCVASRSPRKIYSSDTITDFTNYEISYVGGTNRAFNYNDVIAHFGTSSTPATYNISGLLTYNNAGTNLLEDINFTKINYYKSSSRTIVYFDFYSENVLYLEVMISSSSYSIYYRNNGSMVNDTNFNSGNSFKLVDLTGNSITNTNIIWFFNNYFTLTDLSSSDNDTPITIPNFSEYEEVIDYSRTNPLIYWSNTLYNNGSMIQTPTSNEIYITGVEFMSNGFLFNKIMIKTLSLGGMNITTDNNVIDDNLSTAYSNYSCFYTMFYQYESEDRTYSIHVCGVGFHYLPHSTASTSFAICVNPLEKTWVNEEYKTINVISHTDDLCNVPVYNNLTGYELLKLQSDFTSTTLGDTNIFSLLSGAFSALASILSIRIIPGISIGLLIFIPLVVSIIIAIIKLIGK